MGRHWIHYDLKNSGVITFLKKCYTFKICTFLYQRDSFRLKSNGYSKQYYNGMQETCILLQNYLFCVY